MGFRSLLGCCTAVAAAVAVAAAARADAPLADAAMNNDLRAARTLIRQTVDVNAPQPDGMTALHWAAHFDNLEMADHLLRAGADFRAANRTGATPMYLATVNGSAAMIERLLAAGHDANAVMTETLETVLMLTAKTGNPQAVQVLIDRGADVNARQVRQFTPLMFAAAEGHAGVIKTLLAAGADPLAGTVASAKPERRPSGGMTALLFAAREGHIDAATALVEGGADVNQTGADSTSPLLIALVNGHYELAYMLLGRGADPSIADSNGRAPLFAVIDLRNQQWSQGPAPELPQAEHMTMIETLVAAGADLEQKLSGNIKHRGSFDMRWTELKGGTPFLRAAWNGDIEVMRYLLEQGADPHVVTDKGETALLLLAGAGWPLGQGHIRSDQEIIASLDLLVEELGMDVNAATSEGITGLMAAVFKGTNNVIQYLVDEGARLDVKDNDGHTILDWAHGIAANEGQPPRPQPESEALVRKLMAEKGMTIAMAND
jgi:ankyrin repeat protein